MSPYILLVGRAARFLSTCVLACVSPPPGAEGDDRLTIEANPARSCQVEDSFFGHGRREYIKESSVLSRHCTHVCRQGRVR